MKHSKIRVDDLHGGAAARILLAQPKANILDAEMMGEISGALDALAGRPELRALVFEGEGPNFSFGASVSEHRKPAVAAMLETFHGLFFKLVDLAVPTLAKVRGQCLGGGLELASFCNFVFSDRSAKFGQPEIKLGVFPPPAAVLLAPRIGQARADDLILTGRSIDAETALAWGLVNALGDDLDSLADGFIREHLVPKSASSLRLANAASRRALNERLKRELPLLQATYLATLMQTHDATEGIEAFIAKREPGWTHR
jgi:cyclohexa-1,5-dienecarbonyl-CoA hydratase